MDNTISRRLPSSPAYMHHSGVRSPRVDRVYLLWRPCAVVVMIYLIITVCRVNDIRITWRWVDIKGHSCPQSVELSVQTWRKHVVPHFVRSEHEYGQCMPHVPTVEELQYLLTDKETESTQHNNEIHEEHEICSLGNDYRVITCKEVQGCDLFSLLYYDTRKKRIVNKTFLDTSKLESGLADVVSKAGHFPVVIVSCRARNQSYQQVLVAESPVTQFPHRLRMKSDTAAAGSDCSSRLSLGVIHIDTLSRFDAFRTLPLTTAFLHKQRDNDTLAYDFHLLQSVAQRRDDVLQSLINFGDSNIDRTQAVVRNESRPFSASAPLHALLAAKGFKQLWLKDTCETLLSKNESKQNDYWILDAFDQERMCKIIFASCSYDVSDSSCIQRVGQSVREAAMRLFSNRQYTRKEPTFSLIQISSPLKYSRLERERLDNMLTETMDKYNKNCGLLLILSGHGDFFSESYSVPYGNVAASNPFFALSTTKSVLDAFKINERIIEKNTLRLITVHDIAESIRDVVCLVNATTKQKEKALIREICRPRSSVWGSLREAVNEDRTCRSIRVPQPHMCVCGGEPSFFKNDTINVVYADFAVGFINKMIQEQVTSNYKLLYRNRTPFGRCEKVRGYKFDNVEILKSNNSHIITLDIWVLPSHTLAIPPLVMSEQYKVTLEQTHARQNKLMVSFLKLISIDRISFNWYSELCRDQDVHSDYCLCDERKSQTLDHFKTYKPQDMVKVIYKRAFGVLPKILNLHRGCLVLVTSDYNQSITFAAVNLCRERTYLLRFRVFTQNMIASSGLATETTTLLPLRYYFIGFARQASYALPNKRIVYKPLIGISKQDCVSNGIC